MSSRIDDSVTFSKTPTFSAGSVDGDGTGSPVAALSKSDAGTATQEFRVGSTMRARIRLDASENLVISVHATDGTLRGSITLSGTAISLSGVFKPGLPNYADNAAALAAGLVAGDMYRIGADPKVVT